MATINICDWCGKEIHYVGWTATLLGIKGRSFRISKLLNGGRCVGGYNHKDFDYEICAECAEKLDEFIDLMRKGPTNEQSDS